MFTVTSVHCLFFRGRLHLPERLRPTALPDFILPSKLWRFKFFSQISMSVTHLSWNGRVLTKMCTPAYLNIKTRRWNRCQRAPSQMSPRWFQLIGPVWIYAKLLYRCGLHSSWATCLFKRVCLGVNTSMRNANPSLNVVEKVGFFKLGPSGVNGHVRLPLFSQINFK